MDVHPTKKGINRYWSIPISRSWGVLSFSGGSEGVGKNETRLFCCGEDGADDVQLLVTSGRNLRKVTKQGGDKGWLSFFSCMNLFLFSIAVRFGGSSSPTILVGRPLPLCWGEIFHKLCRCEDVAGFAKGFTNRSGPISFGCVVMAFMASPWSNRWHQVTIGQSFTTQTPKARQPPIQQVIANLLCDLKVNLWPRYAGTWKSLADGWLQSTWKYL